MYTLHWIVDGQAEQTSSHVSMTDAYAAEAAKAAEIFSASTFTLWVDDGVITYHWTKKT